MWSCFEDHATSGRVFANLRPIRITKHCKKMVYQLDTKRQLGKPTNIIIAVSKHHLKEFRYFRNPISPSLSPNFVPLSACHGRTPSPTVTQSWQPHLPRQ